MRTTQHLRRTGHKTLVVVTIIFPLMVTCAYASKSTNSNVRKLATVPTKSSLWVAGKDFRTRAVVAHDASGKTIDVPAYLIDINTGTGDWESAKPDSVPPFKIAIPDAVRMNVALYYSTSGGWLIAPRGWELITAAEGADGNLGFDLVAPATPKAPIAGELGWMSAWSAPGCIGCMLEAGDGIIPGAHKALIALLMLEPSPVPRLVPKSEIMLHPNACTAVFRYAIPNSPPVRAVVYLGHSGDPDETDLGASEMYLAVPSPESALADFIINNFLSKVTGCGGGPGSSPYD